MPDALSKTTPIWIAVMNRLLFPDIKISHQLHTPTTVIPPSEHSQMEARLDDFVEQLKAGHLYTIITSPTNISKSLNLDLEHIKTTLSKPLHPLWVTQDLSLPDLPDPSNFYPIVLCTASRRVPGGEDSENGYIQGAADDHESWAHGLIAVLFWKHKSLLLSTAEDDLPSLIASLVQNNTSGVAQSTLVKPTTQLYVTIDAAVSSLENTTVLITISPAPPQLHENTKTRHIHLPCAAGKVGSRQLRHEIPKILPVLDALLSDASTRPAVRILIACASGKDHSIGVALAVLCLYADDIGELVPREENSRVMGKEYIKQRLSWLSVSMPDANPSRTTLQSVNAFLLG